jgi:hypothetical protein
MNILAWLKFLVAGSWTNFLNKRESTIVLLRILITAKRIAAVEPLDREL